MKNVFHRLAVVICLLVATSAANATLISFDPADTTADMGAVIAVDIIATPEMGELIGAFDFIVNFDGVRVEVVESVSGSSCGVLARMHHHEDLDDGVPIV